MYKIKELYYTLQGEGAHTGRAAVFCRFTGCNLWTGREKDRPKAICQFCDTDFLGIDGNNGGKYSAVALAKKAASIWAENTTNTQHKYIVCTGGEPLLQLDTTLINALHQQGFQVALETNGTIALPEGVDWVCVSPKANTELLLTKGDELKLVFPQKDAPPTLYEQLDFTHFYLQPMDGEDLHINIAQTLAYCRQYPQWRISVQTHKLLFIP
ncbi:MAG: 7-carboxy-7-deazaguanine synthase [Saprospiraceae bacterium]|nr:7-carboxy-7-deazaguanine synthase [Saprospiraceae bacterium]MBP7699107.1 7-carboxy-7-deazaguanine synthase [Saprospiraceae bacterium]